MSETLVIQSYRTEMVPAWINRCLGSVRAWTSLCGLDYRFFGNEIFELVPTWYRERADGRLPVMTDLGRLILVREALGSGARSVFWIDADIFIFDSLCRHVGYTRRPYPNPQLVLSDYLELGDKLGGKMTALAIRFRKFIQIEFLFPTTRVFSKFVFLRGTPPLEKHLELRTRNSEIPSSEF